MTFPLAQDFCQSLHVKIEENLTVKGMPVTTYIGKFRHFPFRKNKLLIGWYARDGKLYDVNSKVGKVLHSFDDDFKSDWGIKVNNGKINIPNASDSDMKGYFERSVDGEDRKVGSVQGDTIRNIKGVVTTWCKKN